MEIWSEKICGKLIFFITDTTTRQAKFEFPSISPRANSRNYFRRCSPDGSIYRVLLCSGNIFAIPYSVRNCGAFCFISAMINSKFFSRKIAFWAYKSTFATITININFPWSSHRFQGPPHSPRSDARISEIYLKRGIQFVVAIYRASKWSFLCATSKR